MKGYAGLLTSNQLLRALIVSSFWVASLFIPSVARTLFTGESAVVYALYVLTYLLGITGLRPSLIHPKVSDAYLVIADVAFAFYLTKYFALHREYDFVLFAVLIPVVTVGTGEILGFIVLLAGAVALWAQTARVLQDLPILGSLEVVSIPAYAFGLILSYLLGVIFLWSYKRTRNEAEKTSLELTRSLVDGEIAKEELIKSNRQVSALLKVSQVLSSSLDPEELLSSFESVLHETIDFDNFSVLVFDSSERCLKTLMSRRKVYRLDDAPKYPLDFGVAGYVFNHGKSRLVGDAEKEEVYTPSVQSKLEVGSLISVPLYYRDEPVGVLNVDSRVKGKFTPEHLRIMEGIAPLLAIAVNNALQFTIVKTASTRDTLTNLYNYSAFTQRFHEIIETCHHFGKPITMVMIDIDDFKQLNDTYGHLTGNHVLAKLGEIFLRFFRRSDVVARYGGEEFAVLLPRTPIDVGLVLAENLREEISVYPFQTVTGKRIGITVSAGVSSNEDDGVIYDVRHSRRGGGGEYIANVEEIVMKVIANADEALYRSKQRGKNRVSASLSAKYPHKEFTEQVQAEVPADIPAIERKKLANL